MGDGKAVAHGEAQYHLDTITADASGNFNALITDPARAILRKLTGRPTPHALAAQRPAGGRVPADAPGHGGLYTQRLVKE